MNTDRTRSARRVNARSQPRTVEAGRPSRAAITRCPAPAAPASSASPITSPASARRARHHAGSSTWVPPHPRHRARRGTNHAPVRPVHLPAAAPAASPRSPTWRASPARRAGQLPAPQLPFDDIPVSVYREHDASERQPSGPPVSGCQTERSGRAAPITDVITVPSHTKKDNPKAALKPVRAVNGGTRPYVVILSGRDTSDRAVHDHHPGYRTWPQYQANQQTLAANAAAHGHNRKAGPALEGPALLQGLIICGRCGRRMTVRYHRRNDGTTVPDYVCQHDGIQNATPICQHMPGATIDAAVADLLLATLTPLALESPVGQRRADPARTARRLTARRLRPARPARRRPGPPPLPGRRPRKPAGRRRPRSRLERPPARAGRRPGPLHRRQDRRRRARSSNAPASAPWPPTCPHCGTTRPPPPANANASCACWSAT